MKSIVKRETLPQVRNEKTGRYKFGPPWDTPCDRCGVRKGVHLAEPPHPLDDDADCPGYRGPR